MSNLKTLIDEWSVKDLEDNSSISVVVEGCTELGNNSLPGIQILVMGMYVTYEPNSVEQWAYKAGKLGVIDYLLDDKSWLVHDDQYVRHSLVVGSPLKAKVIVKTRSSKPISKEYELPFEI